jgi:hypothetical protein
MAQTVGGGLSGKIVAKLHDHGADFKSDFEKETNTEQLLTPERIMQYEQIRANEIGIKHEERIKELDSDKITDENILEAYEKLGGGKRFFKKNSDAIKSEAEKLNNNIMGYDEIIEHETSRRNAYEKLLNDTQKPIDELRKVQVDLNDQINVMDGYEKLLTGYIGKGKDVFNSDESLLKFKDEVAGDTAQEKVNKSEDVVEAGKKEEEAGNKLKNDIIELDKVVNSDEEQIDLRQFLKEQNEAAPATEHEPESGESEKITWQEYLKEQSASGE